MAKNKEEKALEPVTTQPPTPFQPTPVGNLPKYLNGLEVTNPIVLEEGMGLRAMFLGPGGKVEFERADRQGEIDILETWRFKKDGNIVRILGATILDRELSNICRTYELPVEVGVVRSGQKEIAGGKRLSLYTVAVDLKGKKRAQPPADESAPF